MKIDRPANSATLRLNGEEYVILSKREYVRLAKLARMSEHPRFPARDPDGNYPAVDYARASIARTLVRERVRAGLTQKQLARLAGLRLETVCRIEKGRNTPATATIAKLERALRHSLGGETGRGRRTAG
jgi:DNA-binding XRE family transcriptional regulator